MRRRILAVLLSAITFGCWADDSTLYLTSTEYPPYYGETLSDGGPLTQIVTEAFAESGMGSRVRFLPWARALHEGKVGSADGISGIWHSAERETWFVYSNPIMDNEILMYRGTAVAIDHFARFEDLRGFTIGTVRGYANPPDFDAAALTTEHVTDDLQNLQKLAAGRIDLILIDKGVARYILETKGQRYADKVLPIEQVLQRISLYLVISRARPNHVKIRDAFNQGLNQLRDRGRVSEILVQHNF